MMKGKKHKKSILDKIVYYTVTLVVGVVCGLSVAILIISRDFIPIPDHNGALPILLWFAACVYAAGHLHIIVHEGGHLFAGLMNGYTFLSYRIRSFMLIKEDGKEEGRYRIKRYSVAGTLGQCLMMPPVGDTYHFPYLLYNLGGSIANIITSFICLLLYLILPESRFLSVFLITTFVIGIVFAMMNGIPMKLSGIANDGYNACSLGRDREALHAFWISLNVNGRMLQSTGLKELPEEWFRFSKDWDLWNPMICGQGVMRYAYLYATQQINEAMELAEFLVAEAPGLLELHKNELRCELLFRDIIMERDPDEIDEFYTKDLKKYVMATKTQLTRIRLLYAYELLVKNNLKAAGKQLAAFEKAAKNYPYPSTVEEERKLMNYITGRERAFR